MRKIDTSNVDALSYEDRKYLQDRNLHIGLGIPPLPPETPQQGEPYYTGDVDAGKPDPGFVPGSSADDSNNSGEDGSNAGGGDTAPSYDEMSVGDLKDEIDKRNESRPEDDRLSKSGNKADLLQRLMEDDLSRSDDEIIEE